MSFLRPRVPRVSSLVSPVIWVKVSSGIYVKGTLWSKVSEIYAGGDVSVKINGVY
jgi:hypothetical protein